MYYSLGYGAIKIKLLRKCIKNGYEKLKIKLRNFLMMRMAEISYSKNLVMALSVETAELVEIFQWLNEDASLLKIYQRRIMLE